MSLPVTDLSGMKQLQCRMVSGETMATDDVLGLVSYGSSWLAPALRQGVPGVTLHVTHVAESGFTEVWRACAKVNKGSHGGVHFAHDGHYLFGVAEIVSRAAYRDATRAAYLEAFSLLEECGYQQLFRMWNFIPRINQDNGRGLEIYRDFCVGRAEAFEIQARRAPLAMPAATGIGVIDGGLVFYFLARREGVLTHLENPRQMPAWTYPPEHGPRSPSFARATWVGSSLNHGVGTGQSGQLYVSGTASIIGHLTLYPNDVTRQVEVTLENLKLLLGRANLMHHGIDAGFTLHDLDFIKVYVRHAADIPRVALQCQAAFSPQAQIAFLNVDICRASLLVEIEGIIMCRVAS